VSSLVHRIASFPGFPGASDPPYPSGSVQSVQLQTHLARHRVVCLGEFGCNLQPATCTAWERILGAIELRVSSVESRESRLARSLSLSLQNKNIPILLLSCPVLSCPVLSCTTSSLTLPDLVQVQHAIQPVARRGLTRLSAQYRTRFDRLYYNFICTPPLLPSHSSDEDLCTWPIHYEPSV
jgi:hypothetical protein